MDISEIKKRIMEKIQKDKSNPAGNASAAALAILSSKMESEAKDALPDSDISRPLQGAVGSITEDPIAKFSSSHSKEKELEKLLKDHRGKLAEIEAENEKLKALYKDTLNRCEEALSRIKEKDNTISGLEKKIDHEQDKLIKKDKAGIGERLLKFKNSHEYAMLEKSFEEYKKKAADFEAENRSLKELQELTAKERDDLSVRFEEKTKAAGHVETLRSKLYTAEKELKDRSDRLNQSEEALRIRDKKLADWERLYKNLDIAKNEVAVKLRDSEEERKILEEKIAQFNFEIEARSKQLADSENVFRKNLEISKNEITLELQAVERSKKDMEGKVAQLKLETEAKNTRLEESERAYSELNDLVKDSAMKVKAAEIENKELENKISQLNLELEASAKRYENDGILAQEDINKLKAEIELLKETVKEKEKKESEFDDTISYFNSEIEERDKKIEADAKYCEKIVREINELRHKAKAHILKARQTR